MVAPLPIGARQAQPEEFGITHHTQTDGTQCEPTKKMRSVRCTVMLRDGSKCDMKHWSIFMLHAQRVARFRYSSIG